MTRRQNCNETLIKKRAFKDRRITLFALFIVFGLAIFPNLTDQAYPKIVYAGATLTPTIPMPQDTAVPTATTIPPTNTPIPPTNTPVSPTSTPVTVSTNTPEPPAPTATNPPTDTGGNNNPAPTPTATILPVEEIPELGVGGAHSIIISLFLVFLIVMALTGYTVVQATISTKD